MKRLPAVIALVLCSVPVASAATTVPLSGQCRFSGPITPSPPITVVPRPGPHFSYRGRGTCTPGGPVTVTFTNIGTLFDTCELGPDFPLHGVMMIGAGRRRVRYLITVDLVRAALAGPFWLTTTGGGRALGTAQFNPANSATAPQQCASAGVGRASLSASFRTLSPLVGVPDPPRRCRRRCSHHGR